MTDTEATTALPEGWTVTEIDGYRIITRPGEVVARVINAQRRSPLICSRCGKGLADIRCYWTKNPAESFSALRHIDGTGCGEEPKYVSFPDPCPGRPGRLDGRFEGTIPRTFCFAESVCGNCGAIGSLRNEQRAYGDDVTCSTCGDSHYYSIGD